MSTTLDTIAATDTVATVPAAPAPSILTLDGIPTDAAAVAYQGYDNPEQAMDAAKALKRSGNLVEVVGSAIVAVGGTTDMATHLRARRIAKLHDAIVTDPETPTDEAAASVEIRSQARHIAKATRSTTIRMAQAMANEATRLMVEDRHGNRSRYNALLAMILKAK